MSYHSMSLICFVITMVLWVSLFLYMRHRISVLEDRVALLSKLTTAVAGVTRNLSEPENVVKHESEPEDEPEDESEDEPEDEPEDESEDESKSVHEELQNIPVHLLMENFPRMAQSMTCESLPPLEESIPLNMFVLSTNVTLVPELDTIDAVEVYEIDPELPKRKVSSDDVKTLSVDVNYDSLSVKELKDKVAELNGPKLKTKKELLEYLKNKM